jgi:hypothetical protein
MGVPLVGSEGDRGAYVFLADGTLLNAEMLKAGRARIDLTRQFVRQTGIQEPRGRRAIRFSGDLGEVDTPLREPCSLRLLRETLARQWRHEYALSLAK